MENELPVENINLPADHQDAGDPPTLPEEVKTIDFGKSNFSPPPVIRESARVKGEMTFYEALEKCANGAKITRLSFGSKNIYAVMHEAFLYFKEASGKFNAWAVSEGDFLSTDWVVID